ncbi:MAG: Ig-like domain-containing protein, partial [Gemmataceae bacterium]
MGKHKLTAFWLALSASMALSLLMGTAGNIIAATPSSSPTQVQVRPQSVILEGPESTQQVLVQGSGKNGRPIDLTRHVRYEVVHPAIAKVDETGLVTPVQEGRTEIVIHHPGGSARVPVEVRGFRQPVPVSFEQQIMPVLTKAGCNSGGCHGKAE